MVACCRGGQPGPTQSGLMSCSATGPAGTWGPAAVPLSPPRAEAGRRRESAVATKEGAAPPGPLAAPAAPTAPPPGTPPGTPPPGAAGWRSGPPGSDAPPGVAAPDTSDARGAPYASANSAEAATEE